jgi:hypothetical protein
MTSQARSKYQTDRISAEMQDIFIHDLEARDCLNIDMISSFMEIGKMDMKVFSDKRRPFQHSLRSYIS